MDNRRQNKDRIGTWNVWPLNKEDKSVAIKREMERNRLNILRTSETKMKGKEI